MLLWESPSSSLDLGSPGDIGDDTPGGGAFTTLTASSSGARFGSANADYIVIGPAGNTGTRLRNSGSGNGALEVLDGSGAYAEALAYRLKAVNGAGTPTITLDGGTGNMSADGDFTLGGLQRFNGTNSTGAGAALLGANCPAITLTDPYTWITVKSSDGSTCYLPVWK